MARGLGSKQKENEQTVCGWGGGMCVCVCVYVCVCVCVCGQQTIQAARCVCVGNRLYERQGVCVCECVSCVCVCMWATDYTSGKVCVCVCVVVVLSCTQTNACLLLMTKQTKCHIRGQRSTVGRHVLYRPRHLPGSTPLPPPPPSSLRQLKRRVERTMLSECPGGSPSS